MDHGLIHIAYRTLHPHGCMCRSFKNIKLSINCFTQDRTTHEQIVLLIYNISSWEYYLGNIVLIFLINHLYKKSSYCSKSINFVFFKLE